MKNIRVKLIFFIMFIVLYGASFYATQHYKNLQILDELDKTVKKLQLNFNITHFHNSNDAKAIAKFIKNRKDVVDIFSQAIDANEITRAKLRKRLYEKLAVQFKSMKEKGVKVLLFSFADNKIFLRVHKPGKFGDDVQKVRYSIKLTNELHKPQVGFEQGKVTHAFRNVFPIYDKNNHYIGCIDIAYSSDNVQKTISNIHKIHTHFLVKRSVFDSKVWKLDGVKTSYTTSIENPDYMMTLGVEESHPKSIISKKMVTKYKKYILKNMIDSKQFSIYDMDDEYADVISFMPIKNIKNITAAYLVSYTSNDHIVDIVNFFKIINILVFITLVIGLYLIYRQIISKHDLHRLVEEKTAENLKQREAIQQQSKLAAMGEMIGAIAHQWRQPLNVLSINIQNLEYDYEDNLIDEKFIDEFIKKNNKTIKFMSTTIDDFRNFFRVDKEKELFSAKEAIESSLSMQSAQLENHNITLFLDGNDFKINGYYSEFLQVVLNLVNNAKDALLEADIQEPKIKITLHNKQVSILDNAGGIAKDVIDRIFEPYFTTKEQGKGTGMGLYVSKMIIEDNMGAVLRVSNVGAGAMFTLDFR